MNLGNCIMIIDNLTSDEKEELYKIISKHEIDIDNHKYDEIYSDLNASTYVSIPSAFTELLLKINEDPLLHLDYVPMRYLAASDIKSIKMPDNITKIGENAFELCTNLSDIRFSNNLEHINRNAFNMCLNLRILNLPRSLKFIDFGAFGRCENINTINYGGTFEEFKNIKITSYANKPIFNKEISCLDGTKFKMTYNYGAGEIYYAEI